jgi:hypothetical protein
VISDCLKLYQTVGHDEMQKEEKRTMYTRKQNAAIYRLVKCSPFVEVRFVYSRPVPLCYHHYPFGKIFNSL